MKILDVGSGNEEWALINSFETPGDVYVSLDNDTSSYRINSAERAYRFFVGQAVLRAQQELDLDPNDAETGGIVNYLGSNYQLDNAQTDKEALTRLEKYESGRKLLDVIANIPFGDDVEINGRTVRDLFESQAPEKAMKCLEERMNYIHSVAGDFNYLPFKDNALDYVRSSGAAGNIREAQRVLEEGRIVESIDGIETRKS